MTASNRRVFLLQVAACGTALTAAASTAQAQARIEESDPQAKALGYVHDSTKVDKARFPRHSKDQVCTNCALWQGKPTDAWAGCPLFGAKQVAGPGWCSAWAKRG